MSLLFVNACMRPQSRTLRLARMWLDRYQGDARQATVEEVDVAQANIAPLDPGRLATYSAAVSRATYDDPLFDYAKQFAAADEVLIACPFWNFSVPAKLHDYLELVCSQGVTFDVNEDGSYVSLCHAKRLTFICTAGGAIGDESNDHAFGYVRTLAQVFWHIPRIDNITVESLDAPGVNVELLLRQALESADCVR